MAKIIEISGLSLGFQRDEQQHTVLENLHLGVERGEFLAIVGPSGVGKSTLLRVVVGLTQAFAGDVKVLADKTPNRRPIAMVFQEARLLPWRKVLRNIMLGLEGLDLDAATRRERAERALSLVGLAHCAERWPHELSGGQRQRIGLARALAVEPELLLMDEPFAALDAITRQGLQDELLRIWAETKKSILFVTHDIDEAAYLADRVILLGGSPAHVTREFSIRTPRPRARDGAALAAAVGEIRAGLSESYAYRVASSV